MDIKIYQKMNKIVLIMIEKDIKEEKYKSITSLIKEIVDIKSKCFIF